MKRNFLFSFLAFALVSSQFVEAKITTYATFEVGANLGYIMARVVEEAETLTEKPFHTFINGGVAQATSTGAIVGALLTGKLKDGQPYSAAEVAQFYRVHGPQMLPILDMSFWSKQPAERVAPYKGILNEVFKDATLEDTVVPLSILSYDIRKQTFFPFHSEEVKAERQPNAFLRDAVLASSSVANIFGPAEIPFHDQTTSLFQDPGEKGVCDATQRVYEQVAAATAPGDQAVIFSFGTGFSVCDFSNLTADNIELVRIQPEIDQHLLASQQVTGVHMFASMFNPYIKSLPKRVGLANVAGGLATPEMMEPVVQQVLGSDSYQRMIELMLTSSTTNAAADEVGVVADGLEDVELD